MLHELTVALGSDNGRKDGRAMLSIPKNREWDAVKVMKTPKTLV